MEEYVIEADGLLARCILHECDHLDGKLYVDLVEGELRIQPERMRNSMRIVFMGTPDFAVPTLTALIEGGHEVGGCGDTAG